MNKLLQEQLIRKLIHSSGYCKRELKELTNEELEQVFEKEFGHTELVCEKSRIQHVQACALSELSWGSK